MSSTSSKFSRKRPSLPRVIPTPLRRQEEVVIQEYVPTFPLGYIMQFLKKYYDAQEIILEGPAFGFPSKRSRKYVVLSHKGKVGAYLFPVNQFTRLLERCHALNWFSWFCDQDDGEDIVAELVESAEKRFINDRRKKVREAREAGVKNVPAATNTSEFQRELDEFLNNFDVHDCRAFERALPSFEESTLAKYRTIVKKHAAWPLNQNPEGPLSGE